MLSVHHISKSYNLTPVLKDVSFTLNPGERLGLVGPNGCGKTTLLRILAGDESADTGHYQLAPGVQEGYLAQGFLPNDDESLSGFLSSTGGDLAAVSAEVEHLASELALRPEDEVLHQVYDAALTQLVAATEVAKRSGGVLAGFGLDSLPENTRIGTLSGGQKTRMALARILLSNPGLLLLDEPTNHLDQEMLIWLEGWLASFPGGVLVASHDRIFLDRATNGILELDAHTHSVRLYAGGYSDYLEQKEAELDRHWQEYQDQNEEIARLRATAAHLRGLARFRKGGKADSGDKFARGFFADRGAETVGRAKHIEARLERLLTDERIEKPRPDWQMKIEFGGTTESGRDVIVMENLSVGYGDHTLISGINLHLQYRARTVLSGPNGCGKTTLLRTIAGLLPPLTGSVRLGSRVKVGYMTQEQENLDPQASAFSALSRNFSQSETEVRSFLSKFLFVGDEVFVPAGELSYGERARLALALLVAEGCNLLLLDEPINHLDIPSRTRFEKALSSFEGSILAVVHDRYFIQGFAKQIWEARDGKVVEL